MLANSLVGKVEEVWRVGEFWKEKGKENIFVRKFTPKAARKSVRIRGLPSRIERERGLVGW